MQYDELKDTLEVDGKTLVMYAGILYKMDESIGGFMNLDDLTTNKSLQINFVKSILADYNENGDVTGYKLDVFKLKPKDFDDILQWGLDHYTVFTAESSAKTLKKLKMMEEKVAELQKSL